MKRSNINRTDVYRAVIGYIRKKSDKEKFSLELKKYKLPRTLKQNAFFHLCCTYLGDHPKIQSPMKHIKQSIYENHPLRVRDPLHADKLITKTISDCNIEQAGHYIEAVFMEAADQAIDMTDFIDDWKAIKERENANNKQGV